jgi:hypothetical protein
MTGSDRPKLQQPFRLNTGQSAKATYTAALLGQLAEHLLVLGVWRVLLMRQRLRLPPIEGLPN